MKALLLLVCAFAPASAGTLEADAVEAAAPFVGAAPSAAAPAVRAEAGWAPSRPALESARPADRSRRRTADDGFMAGFGFVETPAVAVLDANMSCRYGLCSGNPAVGAFGYGLGLLLMPLACAAGLVTLGWWALFG